MASVRRNLVVHHWDCVKILLARQFDSEGDIS